MFNCYSNILSNKTVSKYILVATGLLNFTVNSLTENFLLWDSTDFQEPYMVCVPQGSRFWF